MSSAASVFHPSVMPPALGSADGLTVQPASLRAPLIVAWVAWITAAAAAVVASALLSGCGGGDANPLGNPPLVDNPATASGEKLAFAYYQRCINPVLLAQLQSVQTGNTANSATTNSCAGSGCHNEASGAGGALRVQPDAQPVNLADAATTPDAIRATAMYKNFYSAQGVTVPGVPAQSRLLNKPLVRGVLHGGGQIFVADTDPNAKLFAYWISHPVPSGQDEFSSAAAGMFTPADPATGACNTQ